MSSRQDFLNEALARVNYLGLQSDLADVVLRETKVMGKKRKFKPNTFGLIAYLFQEDNYVKVDYRDGYGNHAFPFSRGPGYFSPKGFKEMMEKRFDVIEEKDVDSCDVVTLNEFVCGYSGKVAEVGEREVEKESMNEKFARARPISAMFYLNGYPKSPFVMDFFGIRTIDPVADTRRFGDIHLDRSKVNPRYVFLFHALK